MVSVYALEYFIYPGLVDRDTLCPMVSGFLAQNTFTLSWMAYNVGVTISRGSVAFFQIERLWILTFLQFVNAVLWSAEAITHTLPKLFGVQGYYMMVAWMVWVGFMGGGCYANCMHAFNTRS